MKPSSFCKTAKCFKPLIMLSHTPTGCDLRHAACLKRQPVCCSTVVLSPTPPLHCFSNVFFSHPPHQMSNRGKNRNVGTHTTWSKSQPRCRRQLFSTEYQYVSTLRTSTPPTCWRPSLLGRTFSKCSPPTQYSPHSEAPIFLQRRPIVTLLHLHRFLEVVDGHTCIKC